MSNSANKLRPHAIAHGKEKHGEKHRLDLRGNADAQLADKHPYQKGTGHRPETEVAKFYRPDVIAEGEGNKQRDGDVVAQHIDNPE